MSTRIPSGPSRGPENVASTTYVAPCSRCAGPNTSPRRLWAIIMWSRTVTENTSGLLRVADRVAQRRELAGRQGDEYVGQVGEVGLPRQQRVERGVGEQHQRQRHPVGVGARRATGRRDPADLAGPDGEPPGVERRTERQLDGLVAVPAELEHLPLRREQL